jgi:threonine aldolase
MVNPDFLSDNAHGCSPEVAEALVLAGEGRMAPYGNDPITRRVRTRCCELFETEVEIFPVLTGTAGNALAIAAMTPPWGAVFCHEDAHIHREELGAPEFYTNGAKLMPIACTPGRPDGKLDRDSLAHALAGGKRTKQAIPACLSLTNATEAGTVYTLGELLALCDLARQHELGVHLDGARFANAIVTLGCTPADLTWRSGVDILTFGATKNGALGADLIVVFRRELAAELALRYHRGGQRLSKMRLLSAQLEAYLTDDLWLRNARHANAMARRLHAGVAELAGVEVVRPVEANIVFPRLPSSLAERLQKEGFAFYNWSIFGDDVYRLVCGFSTTEEDVDALLEAIRR